MKLKIEPIQIWQDGKYVTVDTIDIVSSYDDLQTYATLYYQFFAPDGTLCSDGNKTIDGANYQDWNTQENANMWVCLWLINELNLTYAGN